MSSKHEHGPEIGEVKTPEGDSIAYYRKREAEDPLLGQLEYFAGRIEKEVAAKGYGPWSKARLFTFMRTHVEKCIQLAERKNQDYTGASEDAFFNLRRGGPFGVAVRLDDKVSRLLALLQGQNPKNEPVEDTVDDIINYGLLLRGLLEEKR